MLTKERDCYRHANECLIKAVMEWRGRWTTSEHRGQELACQILLKEIEEHRKAVDAYRGATPPAW